MTPTTNSPSTAPTFSPSNPSAAPTTYTPTTVPTNSPTIVVGITALQLRRAKSGLLNPINVLPLEVLDLLIRGFFLAVLLTKAVINYEAGDITSFIFFLLSRLWIILLWIIFACKLSHRSSDDLWDENGQPPMAHTTHHHLSKLIKYEVLSSKFRITTFSMVAVCGILDLSILRLLPWLHTEIS
eukprot:gene23989-31142_t